MGQGAVSMPTKQKRGLDTSKLATVFVLFGVSMLIIVLIIGLVFGGKEEATENTLLTSEAALIQQDKYQAIFLNSQDGQVYFGKLSIVNEHLYN